MAFNILQSVSNPIFFMAGEVTYNTFDGSNWTNQTTQMNSANSNVSYALNQSLFSGAIVSCNNTGQYCIAGSNGISAVFHTSNYGSTWSKYSFPNANGFMSCCMSQDGQYMYVTTGGQTSSGTTNNWIRGVRDASGNVTWTTATLTSGGNGLRCVACNNTGQYVAVGSAGISMYYSANYGVSFSQLSTTASPGVTGAIAISDDGYKLYYSFGSPVYTYKTTDALTNSTTINTSATKSLFTNATDDNLGAKSTICVSSDGTYILLASAGFTSVLKSNNGGSTWSRFTTGTTNARSYVAMSRSGKYQFIATQSTNIWYSTNYGATFTAVSSGTISSNTAVWTGPAVSGNGRYCYLATNSNNPKMYLATATN
jgi:glucose/arabinose dehydrogenase